MGLSWRSSSSEGVSHEGVADVDVGVDVDVDVEVNAAVPPPMMQIVMDRERDK